MSDPHAPAPPHGHPESDVPSTRDLVDSPATTAHPPASAPDPTSTSAAPPSKLYATSGNGAQGGQPGAAAASSTELARLKSSLKSAPRQFPDFPSPGILFEDIMPIFARPSHHNDLITALELQLRQAFNLGSSSSSGIDMIVGLESRGFLFGPTLALRLAAGFAPVRKAGKLPGPCEKAAYEKEYDADTFEMQADAIPKGAKVVIVDDIIATGGSAAAAGELVKKVGGSLLGYVFIMELDFLKGRAKLDAPVHTLLSGQEESLASK